MGLDTHDKLLVFGAAHGRALFLVKVDQFEQMMSAWSQKIVSLEQQARASYARAEAADRWPESTCTSPSPFLSAASSKRELSCQLQPQPALGPSLSAAPSTPLSQGCRAKGRHP